MKCMQSYSRISRRISSSIVDRPSDHPSGQPFLAPRLKCFHSYASHAEEVPHETNDRSIGVSRNYNMISNEKIEDFLARNKIIHKVKPNGNIVVKECPFCPNPHNNKPTNLWTLNMKENNGAFLCFRCSTHGSWYDFVKFVMGDSINFEKNHREEKEMDREEEVRAVHHRTKIVVEECISTHEAFLQAAAVLEDFAREGSSFPEDMGILSNIESLSYLIGKESKAQRHLSLSTLKTFRIGLGEELFRNEEGLMRRVPVICFPQFKPTSKKKKQDSDLNLIDNHEYDCVKSKIRGIGKENKHYQRFKPTGGQFGVFGLNTFTKDSKVISILYRLLSSLKENMMLWRFSKPQACLQCRSPTAPRTSRPN